jgi:hypothetical protein
MSSENKLVPLASIPNEHHRSDVGTYLHLPQWSKFFIKEEFFRYLNDNNTKQFPYWENIKLYWAFYYLSYKLTKAKNINILSHLKMGLNALSFTSEYFLKLTYDSCVAFLRKPSVKSSKESLVDTIHQEYLDFMKNSPWYEFDFLSRLIAYYKYNPSREEGVGIKFTEIEKTFFLTVSFLFKQFFAKGIKIINSINYTQTSKTTVIELDYFPESLEKNQEINIVGEYRKHVLLEVPRYKGIKEYIQKVNLDNNLYTIAGNEGIILVSCLFDDSSKTSLIKLAPVIMNKENALHQIRAIYPVPVNYLPGFMKYCSNKKITVEHILEY